MFYFLRCHPACGDHVVPSRGGEQELPPNTCWAPLAAGQGGGGAGAGWCPSPLSPALESGLTQKQ